MFYLNNIQLRTELKNKLYKNGKVLMPLDNYGVSEKFGFAEDQYGVSWQRNLQ